MDAMFLTPKEAIDHFQNLLSLYEQENEDLHKEINARDKLFAEAADWLEALAANPSHYTVADIQKLANELRKPFQSGDKYGKRPVHESPAGGPSSAAVDANPDD